MKKILSLFAVIALALGLTSCGGKETPTDSKPNTTPDVSTSKPSEDKESTSTGTTEDNSDEEDLVYTVKVLLPNGEPYTEGVLIQLCSEQCLRAVATGADGIVKFDERHSHIDPEEIYHVHIYQSEVEFLAKYTYNINAYSVSSTNKSVTIQLIEKKSLTENAGTKADPFKLAEAGAYSMSFDKKGFKFFDYTATKTGKITIEGFGEQIITNEKVDTALVVLDENGNKVSEINKNGIGKNFKYEFDAVEGTNYRFAVGAVDAFQYPATFDFVIA